MSDIKIIIDGKQAEISTETLKIKDGEPIVIKIASGLFPYEKLTNMYKRFGQSFPNSKIIVVPTNVDFEEYPKEVNLNTCIDYVQGVLKDETKPFVEIYEYIYKILKDYKKMIDLSGEVQTSEYCNDTVKGVLIFNSTSNKKAVFVDHPSISVDYFNTQDDPAEITVRGYNISKDIILNT